MLAALSSTEFIWMREIFIERSLSAFCIEGLFGRIARHFQATRITAKGIGRKCYPPDTLSLTLRRKASGFSSCPGSDTKDRVRCRIVPSGATNRGAVIVIDVSGYL